MTQSGVGFGLQTSAAAGGPWASSGLLWPLGWRPVPSAAALLPPTGCWFPGPSWRRCPSAPCPGAPWPAGPPISCPPRSASTQWKVSLLKMGVSFCFLRCRQESPKLGSGGRGAPRPPARNRKCGAAGQCGITLRGARDPPAPEQLPPCRREDSHPVTNRPSSHSGVSGATSRPVCGAQSRRPRARHSTERPAFIENLRAQELGPEQDPAWGPGPAALGGRRGGP